MGYLFIPCFFCILAETVNKCDKMCNFGPNVRKFIRFLKEKGIYCYFFKEVKNNEYYSSSLNKTYNGNIILLLEDNELTPELIIDRSLCWDDTIKGYYFWYKLDKEFRDWYNEIREKH